MKKENLIYDMEYMMSRLQEIQSKLNITSKSLKKDVPIEEINVMYFANYGKMFIDIASDLDEYLKSNKTKGV